MARSVLICALTLTLSSFVLAAFLIRPPSPSTSLTLNATGNFYVKCKPDTYGRNLKPASCAEAVRQIPTTDRLLKFGLRGRQGIDIVTPWRWISSDGVCALEVLETPAAQGTYLNLFAAAEDMIDVCMEFANPTEGSIATNIGVDGKVSLAIMSYKPRVSCRSPLILGGSTFADEILRRMPATPARVRFGRRGVPGVRVLLPLTFSSANPIIKAKLVATVDVTTGNNETASWYDIWAATVAIAGMCVRHGKGGTSSFLGDNGKMVVTIAEFPLTPLLPRGG